MELTWAGAARATGLTTIGMRTLCVPSDQVSWPPVYALSAAVVLVTLTVKVPVAPFARVSVEGATTTSTPAMPVTDAM